MGDNEREPRESIHYIYFVARKGWDSDRNRGANDHSLSEKTNQISRFAIRHDQQIPMRFPPDE